MTDISGMHRQEWILQNSATLNKALLEQLPGQGLENGFLQGLLTGLNFEMPVRWLLLLSVFCPFLQGGRFQIQLTLQGNIAGQ